MRGRDSPAIDGGVSDVDHEALVHKSREDFRRVLRALGILFAAASVATLVLPFLRPGAVLVPKANCGPAVRDLFQLPGSACSNDAMDSVVFAMIYGGISVVFLAFSGIQRRLMFVGHVVLLASPFLMTRKTGVIKSGGNVLEFCGSAIGDFSRYGLTSASAQGATWTLDVRCGEMAMNRFYVMLAVAVAGVLMIIVGLRRGRRPGATG